MFEGALCQDNNECGAGLFCCLVPDAAGNCDFTLDQSCTCRSVEGSNGGTNCAAPPPKSPWPAASTWACANASSSTHKLRRADAVGHPAAMARELLIPRILWFALFLSTLIYLYVLDVATIQGEPSWERLWTGLSIVAVAVGAASLFAPRWLVKRRAAKPNGGSSENRYVTSLIVAMALAETVAIYGLVLGFKGAPPSAVLPFFFGAWILMLIRFPTKAKLAEFE